MRMRTAAVISMGFLGLMIPAALAGPTCRVTDHGAKGDGTTLDTTAIQAAIDACAGKKGGTVLVPGPATYLTGTILLKDHVTLHLQQGAVLLGSDDFKHYQSIDPFVDGVNAVRGACLVGAENASDIAITGPGTIDGRGELWTRDHPERGRRPFLVRFVRCRNVRLSGVLLTRPAAWTCNLYQCRKVRIDQLRIDSHANANNDGIDLDGSRDVRITRSTIDSGDDAICFKTTSLVPTEDVTVTDCDIKSRWGAFKWGTESLGDMRRFRISRCRIRDTAGGGFKILSADGAHVEDIEIRDVTLDNVDMPISFLLRSRRRSYRDLPRRDDIGTIRNVRIENVTGRAADTGRVTPAAGILVSGLPGHRLENIVLRHVHLSIPGGAAASDVPKNVPLQEGDYPEYSRLGVLPAWGAYVRHARDVRFQEVVLEARQADARPEVVVEDADIVGKNAGAPGKMPAETAPSPAPSR